MRLKLIKRWLFKIIFQAERKVLVELTYGYNKNWHSTVSHTEATSFRMLQKVAKTTLQVFDQKAEPETLINLEPIKETNDKH